MMDKQQRILLYGFLSVVLALLVGILGSALANALPSWFTSHLWLLTLLAGVLLVLSALVGYGLFSLQSASDAVTIPLANLNRQRMLARVRDIWVDGVLAHSLHGAVLLALGLQDQPQAVEQPWRLAVQEEDHRAHELPTGTRITQVFDAAQGELLILGEPGSGKSTLLVELTRDLLERAAWEEQPIPVIFPLASWASRRSKLTDWLVEELQTAYQVPQHVGRAWVEHDHLLPLLDGLDEVAPDHRVACVEAINAFRREHGLLPTVVCCRSAEYHAQERPVRLRMAVEVQPLTDAQITEYLEGAGPSLAGLRAALQVNSMLGTLAHSPLMLSVLSLAYQGRFVEDLLEETAHATQLSVFTHFVKQMLQRKTPTPFPSEQILHWLCWLAGQMQVRNQTIFYLEQMQPDWLAKCNRASYRRSVGLVFGAVFGLGVGLGFALLITLIKGLASGLAVGLLSGLKDNLGIGLEGGLISGLVVGLGGGLVVGLSSGRDMSIQPAEALTWSWKKARSGLVAGLMVGFIFGLGGGLVVELAVGPGVGLVVGLIIGLSFGLSFALLSGFSSKQLTERLHLSPNEGIWRSAKNGLLVGMGGGLGGGLVFGIAFGLIFGVTFALLSGLSGGLGAAVLSGLGGGFGGGLIFGLIFGQAFGLVAVVQHFTLRFWLWRTHLFPWEARSFLDDAAARILLRRVGGGYSFIHHLLMDYFANLEASSP